MTMHSFLKDFIYLFLERGERKAKERERNINVWLPLTCLLLRTWPTTQACTLPGNRTSNSLVCRPTLSPLSHTSQDLGSIFDEYPLVCVLCSDEQLGRKKKQKGSKRKDIWGACLPARTYVLYFPGLRGSTLTSSSMEINRGSVLPSTAVFKQHYDCLF